MLSDAHDCRRRGGGDASAVWVVGAVAKELNSGKTVLPRSAYHSLLEAEVSRAQLTFLAKIQQVRTEDSRAWHAGWRIICSTAYGIQKSCAHRHRQICVNCVPPCGLDPLLPSPSSQGLLTVVMP